MSWQKIVLLTYFVLSVVIELVATGTALQAEDGKKTGTHFLGATLSAVMTVVVLTL